MSSTPDLESVYMGELLEKRDVCVACDTSSPLVCPTCNSTSACTFVYPTNCSECARAVCTLTSSASATASSASAGGSINSGAIAGGVVAGVACIAAITYFVWRFFIKTRRSGDGSESWEQERPQMETAENDFASARSTHASTHTRQSIASTVLTRASNIIQIAYIPGVTNRAAPSTLGSPGVLVPPVPPIPIATSNASSPAAPEDQHFFVPGDLRDSTYSTLSGYTDRTSYGRTSYATRSSVASTIYGKNAIIVAPAQTGMRAKPAMVSVKSGHSGGSAGAITPPVPAVDFAKYSAGRPTSPAPSTFSVGSTFLNNASAQSATPARAMVVRVGSSDAIGAKKSMNKPSAETLSSSASASGSSGQAPSTPTPIDDSIPVQSPFADPPDSASRHNSDISNTSLSAVIEEATKRASGRHSSSPLQSNSNTGKSPFSDDNATHE